MDCGHCVWRTRWQGWRRRGIKECVTESVLCLLNGHFTTATVVLLLTLSYTVDTEALAAIGTLYSKIGLRMCLSSTSFVTC